MSFKNDLSILVMSCDKFSPVWETFYELFQKYWPEFDGRIYHYSETKSMSRPGIQTINSGFTANAGNWSNGLLYALEQVETPYVLMMLEDFFLSQKVSNQQVADTVEWMRSNPQIKCTRLVPIPGADIPVTEDLGKISKNAPYRISTQMAIWDKTFLQTITKEHESPWEFEHDGTIRASKLEGEVWAVLVKPYSERFMTHVNGLIRGKLTRRARAFLKDEAIPLNKDIPVNSLLEEFYWFSAPERIKQFMDYTNKNLYSFLWKEKL